MRGNFGTDTSFVSLAFYPPHHNLAAWLPQEDLAENAEFAAAVQTSYGNRPIKTGAKRIATGAARVQTGRVMTGARLATGRIGTGAIGPDGQPLAARYKPLLPSRRPLFFLESRKVE